MIHASFPRRRAAVLCAMAGIVFVLLFAVRCGGGKEGGKETEGSPAADVSYEKTGLEKASEPADHLIAEEETTLSNLLRLTFDGDNGEPYWSPDAKRILYQSTRGDHQYDQIYMMNADGSGKKMVSTGKGRTTCSYFLNDGVNFIYASTHLREGVPPKPEGHGGYEWSFDEAFDVFRADFDGNILERLTDTPGYDAECVVAPSGKQMIWTSKRDGDLDIYRMHFFSKRVVRVTDTEGYDGGAFFSEDEGWIVYRGSRTGDYRDLQIYISTPDGGERRQLTDNDGVNFAPYFHPWGEHIIFSSNMDDPRNFDLYMMKLDGTELTRITHSPGFDGFPHFSYDGRYLLFCSNRAAPESGETHVYRADFTPYFK